MPNDILNTPDFGGFDFSITTDLASSIQENLKRQQNESFHELERINAEACENRRKIQNALDKTAENTGETNTQLQKVIENQNSYIEMLKKQLDVSEQQLLVLKNIFSDNKDASEIEKELLECVLNQLDDKHPLRNFLKDKGGDVAVAGIVSGAPVLYNALKTFLVSKGIYLP